MKLFIASDIHGSALYCAQMLNAFRSEGADRLLLLGDILYHGPRNDLPDGYAPKEVIAMLNPLADRITCVRGNCDAEVDAMVLSFPVMCDSTLIESDGMTIFATHGHIYNPQSPPKLSRLYILLCGHTHIPAFERHKGFVYVNPGSVSIPKENSPHSYMILENETFTWKSLSGQEYRREEYAV